MQILHTKYEPDLPNLNILIQKKYLKSKSKEYGWFINEEFCLGYIIEKKFIFKRLVFTLETVRIKDGNSNEKEFLNGVVSYIQSNLKYVDFIYQPNTTALFQYTPNNSIFCRFGSYTLDLTMTEEELFKGLHSKHRNVVLNAIKKNVSIHHGPEYINDVFAIIKETMVRQNRPYTSLNQINEYHNHLGNNVTFFVAKSNEEVVGGAIIVWQKNNTGYYLHGGSSRSAINGSLNLLQWEIIKFLKLNQVLNYNFVGARVKPIPGSKQEGLQRFKVRFGAELKTGYLWKYPTKKIMYSLYNLTANFYSIVKFRKVYKGDIIDEENNIDV